MKELKFDDLQQINGGGGIMAILTVGTSALFLANELYDFGKGVAAGLK